MARSKEANKERMRAERARQAAEKAAAEAKRAAERDRKRASYRGAALAASKEACQAPPSSP